MSDEAKKRPKRGRPAKNPEKKQRKRSDSLSSAQDQEYKKETSKFHNRNLENYYELHSNFVRDGISQQCQHLIRKIVQGHEVPEAARVQPLLMYFNVVTQEFLLNELEIVVLGIYLEKFAWSDSNSSAECIVRFTSYAAKEYLAEDMGPLNAFLSYKYPGFIENYESWKVNFSNLFMVNPKDLNDKFNELSKAVSLPDEGKIMDYNYYVDEILQCNPNLTYEKNKTQEVAEDPEILELITAIRQKKKIISSDNYELPKDILEKVQNCFGHCGSEEVLNNDKVFIVSPVVLKKLESIHSDLEVIEDEDS